MDYLHLIAEQQQIIDAMKERFTKLVPVFQEIETRLAASEKRIKELEAELKWKGILIR